MGNEIPKLTIDMYMRLMPQIPKVVLNGLAGYVRSYLNQLEEMQSGKRPLVDSAGIILTPDIVSRGLQLLKPLDREIKSRIVKDSDSELSSHFR